MLKPDGSSKKRIIYTYDDKGNEIERMSFKSDGSPDDLELQFYDNVQNGNKFLGKLSGKSLAEFEYDSHGNWTRKTYLIQSGKDGKSQRYRIEERVITYHLTRLGTIGHVSNHSRQNTRSTGCSGVYLNPEQARSESVAGGAPAL